MSYEKILTVGKLPPYFLMKGSRKAGDLAKYGFWRKENTPFRNFSDEEIKLLKKLNAELVPLKKQREILHKHYRDLSYVKRQLGLNTKANIGHAFRDSDTLRSLELQGKIERGEIVL